MKTAKLLQITVALGATMAVCKGAITVNVAGVISSIPGGMAPGLASGDSVHFEFSPLPGFETSVATSAGYNSYEYGVEGMSFVLNEGSPSVVSGIASQGSLTLNDSENYEGLGLHFLQDSLSASMLRDYEVVDWSMSLLKIAPEGDGVVTPPNSATADLFNLSNWDLAGGSIAFRRNEPYDFFTVDYSIDTIAVSGDIAAIPEPGHLSVLVGSLLIGMALGRRRR